MYLIFEIRKKEFMEKSCIFKFIGKEQNKILRFEI